MSNLFLYICAIALSALSNSYDAFFIMTLCAIISNVLAFIFPMPKHMDELRGVDWFKLILIIIYYICMIAIIKGANVPWNEWFSNMF